MAEIVIIAPMMEHNGNSYHDAPREFHELKEWLFITEIEGIVWHHPDGRMAKIKRKDFGFAWPIK